MHVRGTGAIRLYIQLAPWRYSTDTFGVGVWLDSEINITTGFGRKSKSALFNTYYYFVGLISIFAASPVMTRTPVVHCYLVSKA